MTDTGAPRRAGATGAASLPLTGTGATPRAGAAGAASHADELRRLEDVIGGRVLAWVGAVAVLVGLLFLLVIAASRGWIGEEARVVMAATASLVLLAAGAWLHERRGRTDAALAAAATGIAGLFAAIVVAGPVYALVAALAAVALGLGVGAVATLLALRWEAQGVAWLGIVGSLASPLLVGAAHDPAGIAAMLVAYAAAAAVLVRQRWHALAGAAFAIALVQLAVWMLDGTGDPAPGAVIAALTTFGAVGAVAAVGFEWRGRAPELRRSAIVLLALNALALAGLGAAGLYGVDALVIDATEAWLVALALGHLGAGIVARRNPRVTDELALAALGLGVVLADVAFAAIADGLPLVLGWAAGAVAFSALARGASGRSDSAAALAGIGGHMLLAIGTALTGVAPVAAVAGPAADQGLALSALASLAAAAWAAARLVAHRAPELRVALDATALGALGLFSGVALDGVALTLALAGEAATLAAVARRHGHDPVVLPAALAFLGGALAHALIVLAPPEALVTGLDDALHAALGVGAVVLAAAFAAAATRDRRLRRALAAGAALLALHLASALLVTPFQPGADAAAELPLAELDVRQQGQMLLSMLWAITGVATLVAGLLGDRRELRLAALALLTATTAKVFVFDLASLTSLYRVGSCVALGMLLLAGGFAWQRIRPRALPDLRGVPGALR